MKLQESGQRFLRREFLIKKSDIKSDDAYVPKYASYDDKEKLITENSVKLEVFLG